MKYEGGLRVALYSVVVERLLDAVSNKLSDRERAGPRRTDGVEHVSGGGAALEQEVVLQCSRRAVHELRPDPARRPPAPGRPLTHRHVYQALGTPAHASKPVLQAHTHTHMMLAGIRKETFYLIEWSKNAIVKIP